MRVYILSTYPAVRAGLAALLREQQGWSVVGSAAPDVVARSPATSAAEASAGYGEAIRPGETPQSGLPGLPGADVLLVDLDAPPDTDAVEAWLGAVQPRGGIVLLGAFGAPGRLPARGPSHAEMLRELAGLARAADAHGVSFGALPREATPEEIVAALTAVASGLVALDRRVASEVLTSERAPTPVTETLPAADETLTARELEVLQLLAQGLPNKLIANRLRISEHTAKFHVSSIMTKLNAASRTEAVTLAARRGLLIL
jgi:DNA-binding NarL/FixJ family response regulator